MRKNTFPSCPFWSGQGTVGSYMVESQAPLLSISCLIPLVVNLYPPFKILVPLFSFHCRSEFPPLMSLIWCHLAKQSSSNSKKSVLVLFHAFALWSQTFNLNLFCHRRGRKIKSETKTISLEGDSQWYPTF